MALFFLFLYSGFRYVVQCGQFKEVTDDIKLGGTRGGTATINDHVSELYRSSEMLHAVLHDLATQEACCYVVVANNFMKRVKRHQML